MLFESKRKIKKLKASNSGFGQSAALTVLMVLMFATTPAGAGILGVDVGVSIGGGGVDVDADVGVGGTGAGVSASVGIGGPGVPGEPVTPGVPGVVDPGAVAGASGNSGANGLGCAKDGNETAYNGFVVRDRDGAMIGWVHETTVSKGGKVLTMRIQSTGNSCYKLANAGFRISNQEVWVNVDGTSFR